MSQLTCLVPVRNGARYLELFLERALRCFDRVIALDDGSTDSTLSVLESASIVEHVIRHPVRPSYVGWDDLLNRNKLLQYLSEQRYCGWTIFLDVDELLDVRDAELLREMTREGTLDRGCAYGLRVFRMVDDLEHFYKRALMVYRLFYFQPGYTIAGNTLHFVPVPTAYPPETWRPTNLRVLHRNSLTESLRQERYAKYQEADPDRRFQESYEKLLDAPHKVRPWSDTDYSDVFQVRPI